jgi:hypothetical protein
MADNVMNDTFKGLKVPHLKDDGYATWWQVVKRMLKGKRLLEVAEQEMPKPTSADWDVKDAQAGTIIYQAIGQDQWGHISDCDTAKQMIDRLKEVYQPSQSYRAQRIHENLVNLDITGMSIDLIATKYRALKQELDACGDTDIKVSDPILLSFMLSKIRRIDDKWDQVVFTIQQKQDLTFIEAVENLKRAELHHPLQSAAKDQQNQARTATSTKLLCYNCQKEGYHLAKDCPEPKKERGANRGRGRGGRRDRGRGRVQPQGGGANIAMTAMENPQRSVKGDASTALTACGAAALSNDPWILDSGCSTHMSPNYSLFTGYAMRTGTVSLANGERIQVTGEGSVQLAAKNGASVTLQKVLHVPNLSCNLVSIKQLTAQGFTCLFDDQRATIRKDQNTLTARSVGNGWQLTVAGAAAFAATAKISEKSAVWHRRLGHPGQTKTKQLPTVVDGLPATLEPHDQCDACAQGKSVQKVNKVAATRATTKLERVHMDFWGPVTPSIGNAAYMLTLTDDFTRKVWIITSPTRASIASSFPIWRKQVELQSGCKLKSLRMDNAAEFLKLAKNLESEGVYAETTVVYTPNQNGVAERLNRTLIQRTKVMLIDADLPQCVWAEAAAAAAYLHNRSPTKEGTATPQEVWSGKKQNVGHLKVFGCVAFTHVPHVKRHKLDASGVKGIMVGYTESTNQWRIWNPVNNTVQKHTSVHFRENELGGSWAKKIRGSNSNAASNEISFINMPFEVDEAVPAAAPPLATTTTPLATPASSPAPEDTIVVAPRTVPSNAPIKTRSGRVSKPSEKARVTEIFENGLENGLDEFEAFKVDYTSDHQHLPDPATYAEAMSSPDARHWDEAMKKHLLTLESMHSWDIVIQPEYVNIVTAKWVYKKKLLPNGLIDEYKARMVGRGFTQTAGEDYFETFSPVVRIESLRILLAIAAAEDWPVHQMDVVSAYFLGELKEEVYMAPPPGLEVPEGHCLLLRKGMPGLKQSGRVWNQKITAFFEEEGLLQAAGDHCVFFNRENQLYVGLYVDDMIICSPNQQNIDHLKTRLSDTFKMKDLGPAKHLLGMVIERDQQNRSLTINLNHYIRRALAEFGLAGAASVATPSEGYQGLQKSTNENEQPANVTMYQRLVGQLNWCVRVCRPDIAFVTQKLSQHAHKPMACHWQAALRVLRYLKGTQQFGITYQAQKKLQIQGWCDSDYAADVNTRRSTMGWVFTLAGGAITWSSKLQRSVSTSTTEAEYYALSHAAKEAIWAKSMVHQLGLFAQGTVNLNGDNQSALQLVKNPEFHAKTKHIDVALHHVREATENGEVNPQWIATAGQIADCLTKPLSKQLLQRHVEAMGMTDIGRAKNGTNRSGRCSAEGVL